MGARRGGPPSWSSWAADTRTRCLRSKSGLKIGDQGVSVCRLHRRSTFSAAARSDFTHSVTSFHRGYTLGYAGGLSDVPGQEIAEGENREGNTRCALSSHSRFVRYGIVCMVHAIGCRSRWQCDRNTRLKIGIEVGLNSSSTRGRPDCFALQILLDFLCRIVHQLGAHEVSNLSGIVRLIRRAKGQIRSADRRASSTHRTALAPPSL
jgi:hypothetical protein